MINKNKLKTEIACPYGCDKDATLKSRPEIVKHQGIERVIDQFYYECDTCDGSFTTTESDTVSTQILY